LIAAGAILVYPVGLLLLNAYLLYKARHAITSRRSSLLSRSIAFLHREYKVEMFWWELVEMLRRFILVGVMVLVQGTMMQLVMGTLLSAAFLLFQVQAQPYVQMSDDLLAAFSSFLLTAFFLCSYAFRDAAIFGLADIQDKMSVEQKDLYVINQGTLITLTICCMFGSLLMLSVIFAVQVAAESPATLSLLHFVLLHFVLLHLVSLYLVSLCLVLLYLLHVLHVLHVLYVLCEL
jgi:hypothetical protein